MKHPLVLYLAGLLLLAGCATSPPVVEEDEQDTTTIDDLTVDIEEEAPLRETQNVIYQGVVKPAGISIYQQGSHRLELADGRFILLESESIDLNGYVSESVEIHGALRPTVEAGGMIMRVETIQLLTEDVDEENVLEDLPGSDEVSSDDEDEEEATAAEEDTQDEPQSEEEQDDQIEDTDEDASEDTQEEFGQSDTSSSAEPEDESTTLSPELAARTEKMSSENFAEDQWTQQYCTEHIGFCIPVHRNWWFKSFGTTSSYLWHIELSSEEIDNLSDGPIHVNLITGTVGAKKATDGQVRLQSGKIIGYRSWTDNRHFEISAPASLEESVRYITANLRESVED